MLFLLSHFEPPMFGIFETIDLHGKKGLSELFYHGWLFPAPSFSADGIVQFLNQRILLIGVDNAFRHPQFGTTAAWIELHFVR